MSGWSELTHYTIGILQARVRSSKGMPSGKNAWLAFLTFDLKMIKKIVILHAQ